MARPRLALIDGFSLFHRAFFALPALATLQGQPTGAVYGFLTMTLRLLEDERPTHLAVAMDREEPTFRHEEFGAYKGQRDDMPAELRSQLPLLRQVLDALAIPTLESPGAEADDVIGTIASAAAAAGFDVLVVTGDRDHQQLVSPEITVLITRRGITDIERMDVAAIRGRYGLAPAQLVDVKALAGDASDNYPGVPAVGEKTACRLVAAYGSVEALLGRLDEVGPPRVQQGLRERTQIVQRNKRLATIRRDVPLAFEPDSLLRAAAVPAAALSVFEELGFHKLAARYGLRPAEGAAERAPSTTPPALPSARAVASDEELIRELAAHSGSVAVVAERPEGESWALAAHRVGHEVPGIAWQGGDALPSLPRLVSLLAHDSKRLCHAILAGGGQWETPAFDATIAGYLLDAERGSYPLADLCRQFGVPVPREGDLAEASAAVASLHAPMTAAIAENGLDAVYTGIELPLVGVLAGMERAGVLVDPAALAALEVDLEARLTALEEDVYAAAGERFKIGSPQQLARILFDRLGLTPPKKTKTGYSTDAEVLEQLSAMHPLPAKVLTFRTLQKLQSQYVQALPGYIAGDGRIHTDYRHTVSATGRLSSQNPNLQSIPVRDEVSRPIRRVFVAPEGWRLVAADYSQVELRVLAHFSGDESLLAAFREGRDIHRATAAEVWGVAPEDVTADQREAAKAVNFGIVYGISDFGLARQIGCPVAEAHQIIARYFSRYPGVKRHMDGAVEEARMRGAVRTLYGRMRRMPEITARNFARRSFAERTAMNTPIQGTAADIIKRAMAAVHAELAGRGLRARLLMQVHDELILEAPEGEVPEAAATLARCMERAGDLRVPLRVDVSAGPNWLDLEGLPFE